MEHKYLTKEQMAARFQAERERDPVGWLRRGREVQQLCDRIRYGPDLQGGHDAQPSPA